MLELKHRHWLVVLLVILVLSGGNGALSESGAPKAPPGMVYVPAGPFLMGSNMYQRDERPARQVHLDAFFIDITEVTFGDYYRCRRARKCRTPRRGKSFGRGFPRLGTTHPVIGVTWYDAQKYCKWAGKRLPTEAEWEKAARGVTGYPYPWGATIDCTHANYARCDIGHPQPVSTYPEGRSPCGAYDMAGNVQEWVADWYSPRYYSKAPEKNPPGPADGTRKVLRGGSYDYVWSSVRTSFRYADLPENYDNGYGFRCARD